MNVTLSVLIPCYNEAATIGHMIESVRTQKALVRQIVVVNDGSTDDTRHVLEKIQAGWSDPDIELTVIQWEKNFGKGASVRAAIKAATASYILIQDADKELDPSDYPALVKPIVDEKADVVFGNRFPNGFLPSLRLASRIANWVVTTLTNVLYGMHVKDQACGYKLMQTTLANNLDLKTNGFEICSEMASKLGLRHLRVASVPVHYDPRSAVQGKKIRWTDGFICVYTIIRLRL